MVCVNSRWHFGTVWPKSCNNQVTFYRVNNIYIYIFNGLLKVQRCFSKTNHKFKIHFPKGDRMKVKQMIKRIHYQMNQGKTKPTKFCMHIEWWHWSACVLVVSPFVSMLSTLMQLVKSSHWLLRIWVFSINSPWSALWLEKILITKFCNSHLR